MEKRLVFKAENICKSFPGVKALDNVSFELYEGEVFAILGENGAGKSTFIKVMSGVYQAEEGTLHMDGKHVRFPTPRSAFDAGICVVHQEFSYVAELTVAENIMMSNHPRNKYGFVSWSKMYQGSIDAMKKIDLEIDPKMKMAYCSVAQKQQIEIAKSLYWNAKILILDEPTSALNNVETENLMNCLDAIKKSGTVVIYITHKIEELFRISDRVGVLRDGQHVKTLNTAETNKDELISLMVGRTIHDMYPKQNSTFGDVVMKVENLSSRNLKDISFEIRRGEILGVYGLMGSGHSELGAMLFGNPPPTEGNIFIDGEIVRIKNPSQALLSGLAYVPSERKIEGLVLSLTVLQNIVTAFYQKAKKHFLDLPYEKEAAKKWIDRIRIRTPSYETPASSLSGGNQQKVVLAKWMEINPKVLIMNEPTRGIDVGSKSEIYQLLDSFCSQGISVIMITSEMAELLAMSDKVIVMHDGRISSHFVQGELSQIKVVSAAIGEVNNETA